jgi:hypothetical protein
VLKLGKGFDRKAVRAALRAKGASTVRYVGVLAAEDIREAVAGIRQAGSPPQALPVLSWLASHPNAPADVLEDLESHGPREVLMSLCLNTRLPADMRRSLLAHKDEEVRRHANHVFSRPKRH